MPLTVTPIRAPAVLKLHLQLHSSFDISSSKHYWPEKEELRSDSCCVNGGENCFKHKNSTTLQCCEHCHIKKIVTHSLTHSSSDNELSLTDKTMGLSCQI